MTQTAIQCIPFGSPAKEIREIFAYGIRNPESTAWNPESKTVSVYTFLYMGRYLALFISHYEQFSLSHTHKWRDLLICDFNFYISGQNRKLLSFRYILSSFNFVLYYGWIFFSLCVILFKKVFSSQGEIPCMV